MQVDNSPQSSAFFTSDPYASTSQDLNINDFLNPDIFSSSSAFTAPSDGSSSSRGSSPQSALLATPPQGDLPTSFPDMYSSSGSGLEGSPLFSFDQNPTSFFNILDMSSSSYSAPGEDVLMKSSSIPSMPYDFFTGLSNSNAMLASSSSSSSSSPTTIDPQLVDSPTPTTPPQAESEEPLEKEEEEQPLTLKIAPVKVGGHGKARKGTVQSGGIAKKAPAPAPLPPTSTLVPVVTAASTAAKKDKENKKAAREASREVEDDDDDLPADWRPPPEVFQKMSSKEKRQLRNKISARNFRVRRKEYISTLELDIAERDRLLQAIRTELGSTQSENVALRQEIGALKKALLEGRTGVLTSDDIPVLNLPPPAPIPLTSSAPTSSPSPALLTPNTQKDVSATSPRAGSSFWGGAKTGGFGIGSGITPVHTVFMPELNPFTASQQKLQENMNPALNAVSHVEQPTVPPAYGNFGVGGAGVFGPNKFIGNGGFDGFADATPFTMKTLDAYRMQLWTKMASQHIAQSQQHASNNRSVSPPPLISSPSPFTNPSLPGSPNSHGNQLNGLAASLSRLHFSKDNLKTPSSPPIEKPSAIVSALLSGKHIPGHSSLPSSSLSSKEKDISYSAPVADREQQQHAMVAALASQTLLRKLGGAFWEAFSAPSTTSSAPNSGAHAFRDMSKVDVEKVRKVLEGKAVIKIVDVEPTPPPMIRKDVNISCKEERKCDISSLLEEGLRGLTISVKK